MKLSEWIERLPVEEALIQGKRLPWALIRALSQVTLGPVLGQIDLNELLEARFFDETQEIRIFREEDALQAVRLREWEGDDTLAESFQLEKGGIVTLLHILDADEDGQVYRLATRLAGWKEAQ